ncbi:penicillin-binding protein 2 [Comamonas antarctica]|uniref:penicillin-binding protein 2 n=1 Tax=Comamonas antarctica TaxID=2743470 RepID=UPI0028EF3C38|nr:penicillin-binding protein 2 [Comamonas antarctica]
MMEVLDSEAEQSRFRLRVWVIAAVVLLAFCVLVWRLLVLQVVRHEDLAERAESNRTAVVPIVPNRGQILDRNGVVLATNYAAYTLEITRSKVKDLEATIDELATLVEITPRDRRKFKRLVEDSKNFESLPIRTRLSDEEVAHFAAQRYRFPGVDIKARLFRSYPLEDTASHVIGYIGRINQREKEVIEDSEDAANYRGTEVIGKLGIEQSYEKDLHGLTGWEQLETSAGGYAVRKLGSRAATPGDSLVLSLDIRLQRMVEQLYGNRRGALVAIDPRNGEVLAMVSRPTFDLNLFVDGIDQESWSQLNESIDRPMLNRALRGTYPPGSTYKPFMALGALELGARRTDTIVQDNGSWTFGGHTFRSGHPNGAIDMHRAIVKSSNVYFYQLANDMGVDTMHDFMKPLGFGQLTGLDVRGEARGVLPSQEWKRNTYKRPEQKKWYAGETISLGIGQGYNNFTLLQLAHAMATLANNGVKHQPHLGLGKVDALTRRYEPLPQPAGIDLGYKPQNVAAVRRAVAAVTVEGTARGIFMGAPYTSAGKTGTAQAVSVGQKEKYNAARLSEYQRDHSLYMAYAPADNPTIALALIVENAGFGAVAAGPIARRVFDYWLLGQYPSEEDMASVRSGQARTPMGQPRRANDITLPADSVALEGLPRKILPDPYPPAAPAEAGAKNSAPGAKPATPALRPPTQAAMAAAAAASAAWVPED